MRRSVTHYKFLNTQKLRSLIRSPARKKHDNIIAIVKIGSTKYSKYIHKYRVEYPKTEEDELELDRQDSNSIPADTIVKERKNVQVAFDVINDVSQQPNEY